MKFVDEINVKVKAGSGGNGVVSFRRELHVAKGGPDGGNGGNGGSVYFLSDSNINTLFKFKNCGLIKAQNGKNGKRKKMFGASGEDVYVLVPPGTCVYDSETKNLVADITKPIPYLIAKGGVGGKGNHFFKSSVNHAPRLFENGSRGETKSLKLVLKVIANLGLVGLPSAGKSSLLAAVSKAKPKIAPYEFTTLTPNLGMVKYNKDFFVVADLPGIIAGASSGLGLGTQFLKHAERCQALAFVIDMGTPWSSPKKAWKILQNELNLFSVDLSQKKYFVVASKSDLPNFQKNYSKFKNCYSKLKIVSFSVKTLKNLNLLKRTMHDKIASVTKTLENPAGEFKTITLKKEDINVKKTAENVFEVSGRSVTELYHRIPLTTQQNIIRFKKKLEKMGVWRELVKLKAKTGDKIQVLNYYFFW